MGESQVTLAGGPFGWSVVHVADEDFWRWCAWNGPNRAVGSAVSFEQAEADAGEAAQALSGV